MRAGKVGFADLSGSEQARLRDSLGVLEVAYRDLDTVWDVVNSVRVRLAELEGYRGDVADLALRASASLVVTIDAVAGERDRLRAFVGGAA